jgi:putative hemolysin
MKRILTFILCVLALTACTAPWSQTPDITTGTLQANMPNPASVYCTQQGNKLEIRTADDGSQQGICVFPDGSTCDEWAYYRGECGPAPKNPTPDQGTEVATPANSAPTEAAEAVVNWWGYIRDTGQGAQYDDYFERHDLGQVIYLGID